MESIHKQTQIKSHLNFIEGLMNKHGWAQDKHTELMQSLYFLKDRERDKSIYLAVVGEFGSGKSTLLNAILGNNILKSENIQGTTSVATYIRYGVSVDVEVSYKNPDLNKKSMVKSFFKIVSQKISWLNPQKTNNETSLVEYIHRITTSDDLAEEIAGVTLYYPSLFLKPGMVLIDTPGGNVKNENHKRITVEIVNNKADASIIVIPSDRPLSNTLINFINANLMDSIHRCIFVVTKTDLIICETERKELFNVIRARLDNEFGINQSHVMELSPHLIILNQYGNLSEKTKLSKEDKEYLLKKSRQSLDSIARISSQQKHILYNEGLLRLILNVFKSIEGEIKQMDEESTHRISLLKSNPLTDLNTFLNQQNKNRSMQISFFIEEKKQALNNLLSHSEKDAIIYMRTTIGFSSNKEELRNNVDSVPDSITKYGQVIENMVDKSINEISQFTRKQLEELQIEFEQHYSILSKYGRENLIFSTKEFHHQQGFDIDTVNETVGMLYQGFEHEDNVDIALTSGGAGVGAFIGTIILPGIGSFIGGILGGIIGTLFGSSLDKQKSRCETQLEEGIQRSFEQLGMYLDNYMKDFEIRLLEEFSRRTLYYRKYNRQITQMITEYENTIKGAEYHKNNMEQELIELAERRRKIENDLKELRAHI